MTDAELAERLAARTLELVDVPSESREEAALAAHVTGVLAAGSVPVRDRGDGCLVAGPPNSPLVLGGHLDPVPAPGNPPGRRGGERRHGRGGSS